jgi:putative nucleotide binding protein
MTSTEPDRRDDARADGGDEAGGGTAADAEPEPGTEAEAEGDATTDRDDTRHAVVVDYLPHGRSDDDRPRYEKSPVAYALGVRDFQLFELTLGDDADVSIGDRVVIAPAEARDHVDRIRTVEYDDLPSGARTEIEYVVEEIVDADERRFVDFYNDAQPITLRLHQLNLLPGIGKKLRNNVLDQRKRGPFESFEDLTDRVSGLHRPKEVLVERIIEELKDDDLKYRVFVGRGSRAGGDGG